jgi:hypothetical protein
MTQWIFYEKPLFISHIELELDDLESVLSYVSLIYNFNVNGIEYIYKQNDEDNSVWFVRCRCKDKWKKVNKLSLDERGKIVCCV